MGFAVDHHPQRLHHRLLQSRIKPGVVGGNGPDSGYHRTTGCPQPVHVCTRFRAGDPLAAAVAGRRAPIHRCSKFYPQPRFAVHHALDESGIELGRSLSVYPDSHVDAGVTQACQAGARDLRVGVFHGCDHTPDPGIYQCLCARSGSTGMTARFQRDEGLGAAGRVTGSLEGVDFGVGSAGTLVPSLSDDLLVAYDHAADHRVGLGRKLAPAGEFQCPRHEGPVPGGVVHLLRHSKNSLADMGSVPRTAQGLSRAVAGRR